MPLIRLNPDLRVINCPLRINKENIWEPTAGLCFDFADLPVETLFEVITILACCHFLFESRGEEHLHRYSVPRTSFANWKLRTRRSHLAHIGGSTVVFSIDFPTCSMLEMIVGILTFSEIAYTIFYNALSLYPKNPTNWSG